jgi:Cdc6-like AAA superfamily ATPase
MPKRGMRPEERARRMQALIQIVIQHPRLLTVEERVDELIGDTETMMKVNRKRAAETRGNEHPDHLWMLPIVGPSGGTKSKTIQSVRAKINKTARKGEIRIDYVSIKETTKNTKALYHQIFEALGDTNNMLNLERTTNPAARVIEEAIRNTIAPRSTRVLVLDEIHNLLIHAGRHTCKAMAQALKGIRVLYRS